MFVCLWFSFTHTYLLKECNQLKEKVRMLLNENRKLLVEQADQETSYGEENRFCESKIEAGQIQGPATCHKNQRTSENPDTKSVPCTSQRRKCTSWLLLGFVLLGLSFPKCEDCPRPSVFILPNSGSSL